MATRPSTRKHNGRPLALESLEQRRMFAAEILQDASGEIVIQGTEDADRILLYPTDVSDEVVVKLNDVWHQPFSSVKKITIHGEGGNDVVAAVRQELSIPLEVFGGAGNDRIYGGVADDVIEGGSGRDTLFGGWGNDRLDGGAGNDAVAGGNGFDVVYGGEGNDRLRGGSRDDVLYGGDGRDTLFGEYGHDVLLGEGGGDRLFGSFGRSVLIGGNDRDLLESGPDAAILIGGDVSWSHQQLVALGREWVRRNPASSLPADDLISLDDITYDDAWNHVFGGVQDWFLPAGRKDVLLPDIFNLQGEMAGEVTDQSVILQSRLTRHEVVSGDVPGTAGIARFEISQSPDFADSVGTDWLGAEADQDFIIKTRVAGLKPGTRYYYRLVYGQNEHDLRAGPVRSFTTLPGDDSEVGTQFIVTGDIDYGLFHVGVDGQGARAYTGPDKDLGQLGLKAILDHSPDFVVSTGDTVSYDAPGPRAETQLELRQRWHEQFVQPRFVDLVSETPFFFLKDDHDYRFNDGHPFGDDAPSHELGVATFREQVPVVDPEDADAVTYRTHRVSEHLQIWLLEGRDYRDHNRDPDGPEKSIWGDEQAAWLKSTLLASDATFKTVITPTPLIGPDVGAKLDNHTNGFRYERDEFFQWLTDNGFGDKGLFFVTGDRHWQYHSIDPSGFEEFSHGALDDSAAATTPARPGDWWSTDPEGMIVQPYVSPKPSGGFLQIEVQPPSPQDSATIHFRFYDENNVLLYEVARDS